MCAQAIDRRLADSLQTFDDVLLSLYRDDIEIYTVSYKNPKGALAMLGADATLQYPTTLQGLAQSGAAAPPGWAARLLSNAFGLPTPPASPAFQLPQGAARFHDPRYG